MCLWRLSSQTSLIQQWHGGLENVRRVRGTDRRERFGALFTASLKNPVPPSLVAQRILEVAGERDVATAASRGPDVSRE